MVQEFVTLSNFSTQIGLKFIGIFSLLIATFSYIGLILSYYVEKKRAKLKKEKREQERKNLDKIHAQLEALQKA